MATPILLIFVNDRNLFSLDLEDKSSLLLADSTYPLISQNPVYILWLRDLKNLSSQDGDLKTPNFPKRSLFTSKMKISRFFDASIFPFKKDYCQQDLVNEISQLINSSSNLETVLKKNFAKYLDISDIKKLNTPEQITTYNLIVSDYHDRKIMIWKYPVVPNSREIENHVIVFEAEKKDCLGYGKGSLALTTNNVVLNSTLFLNHSEDTEFLIKVYRCPAEIKHPLFQNKHHITKQFEEFLKLFPLPIADVPVDSIVETAQIWLEKNAL